MKKRVSGILALILCLSLCACESKPSAETLVSLADQIVNNYGSVTDSPYEFRSLGYDEEANSYMVAVLVDTEKISQLVAETDVKGDYIDLMIEVTASHYEQNTEAITLELTALKSTLDANFMDTDISVMVGFFDRNGEIVQIAD